MKIENLAKISLGKFPTPLDYMPNLTARIGGGDLYIKRDDFTDVGLGGNKIRKLEYLIKDALDGGYTTLLTFGGPQTNHGRLTAAAAVKVGMKCILVLGGERPDYMSGNLLLDSLFGADLYFSPDDSERLADEVIAKYEAAGEKVYRIPVGGSNMIGAAGYINMIPELMDQVRDMGISPKYLVATAGSMGTFGGLWLGAKYYGAPFSVLGVQISPAKPDIKGMAAEYINTLSGFYEMGISVTPGELDISTYPETPYAGLGYNIPDDETRAAIKLLAETEAVLLDPVYTGKTFRAFVDFVRSGRISKGESAIFLHSGGIPALFTKEHLDAAQESLWTR